MADDEEGISMEGTVEGRLSAIEARLSVIESRLGVERPSPAPRPPAPAPPRPARPAREPLDLEELLGGRLLGWVGGIAVVLAAVFFLAMAIHNGWVDESTRGVLALARPAPLRARRGLAFRPKGRAPGPPRARPPRHRTL